MHELYYIMEKHLLKVSLFLVFSLLTCPGTAVMRTVMSSSLIFLSSKRLLTTLLNVLMWSQCSGITFLAQYKEAQSLQMGGCSLLNVFLLTEDAVVPDCMSLPPLCHQWHYLAVPTLFPPHRALLTIGTVWVLFNLYRSPWLV